MKRFVPKGGGAAPRPQLRKIHCPVCASLVNEARGDRFIFSCEAGGALENSTGHALRNAVYRADPPRQPPRASPELADYLWCPNCTAAMDDYDERGRELRCAGCGLSIPSALQVGLIAFKEDHRKPDSEAWNEE
ncbi:MAG TPA: hypothetical protein VF522_19030 [Ramlibacter sp.]|uniref:hypothetical protein n=1 Tax=Ramlibacter sp. TaxID=1917967 RepID=UPI002ED67FFD